MSLISRGMAWAWWKIDGWKTIVPYLILQLPFLSEAPWAVKAIQEAIANPTPETIIFALGQVILATGILHRIVKNIQYGADR